MITHAHACANGRQGEQMSHQMLAVSEACFLDHTAPFTLSLDTQMLSHRLVEQAFADLEFWEMTNYWCV